jgi:hypothetical protein
MAGPNKAEREASRALCSNDVVRSMARSLAIKVLFVKYKQNLYCTCKRGGLLQKMKVIMYVQVNVISTHVKGPI